METTTHDKQQNISMYVKEESRVKIRSRVGKVD